MLLQTERESPLTFEFLVHHEFLKKTDSFFFFLPETKTIVELKLLLLPVFPDMLQLALFLKNKYCFFSLIVFRQHSSQVWCGIKSRNVKL